MVSSNDDFYNVIQYGDILEAVGNRVEYHQEDDDIDVTGQVTLSPSAYKMSATVRVDVVSERLLEISRSLRTPQISDSIPIEISMLNVEDAVIHDRLSTLNPLKTLITPITWMH